jgi:hypothetical protein
VNRHLRISFSAEFLPAVGMSSAPKADVNISVGKLHFGLTNPGYNRKIEAT